MLRLTRWFLVLPTAVAAWYLALLIGIGLILGLEQLCPADQMVSGQCTATWYDHASYAAICFGAALAAALILGGCTIVAPSHRTWIAGITFVLGVLVAIIFAMETHFYLALAAAIVSGILVLRALVLAIHSGRLPDKSLERTRAR
jgi:hypothetical protein